MSDAPAPRRRFRITANQITVARILLLPFPCWALIARPDAPWMWTAFVFGALVGATDFVDGWLARRDGPTVLGSLLDPVADKLFIAMLLLPEVAHGECPGWAAAALFVRELWITALRTSLSVRKQSLKTSQLGKLKTVVQMGGIAAFFLTIFVPGDAMPWAHFTCATAVLVYGVIMAVKRRSTPPSWVLGAAPIWYLVFASAFVLEPLAVGLVVFMAMVILTWVSGADYFWGAGKILKREGIHVPDIARTAWSWVHGVALIPLVEDIPALVIPVMSILCAELALGGIDNIVSAQRGRFARGSVWPTTLAALGVGACGWWQLVSTDTVVWMAWALTALSLGNLVVAFVREREVFFAPDRPLSDA